MKTTGTRQTERNVFGMGFDQFLRRSDFGTCVNESQCWLQYIRGWGKLVRMCRTLLMYGSDRKLL